MRDIYEKEYARSNTMFKLTYQAFMMFGMVMAYAFVRLWLAKKHRIRKALMTAGFVCFAGCCCYVGTAVHSWFGQVWNRELYQGLDATAFLETDFPEDAAAIRWLNDHVEGQPVVLEANGDSYSDYERVSAMTGLPTVLGWYVHEWLWRGNIEDLMKNPPRWKPSTPLRIRRRPPVWWKNWMCLTFLWAPWNGKNTETS